MCASTAPDQAPEELSLDAPGGASPDGDVSPVQRAIDRYLGATISEIRVVGNQMVAPETILGKIPYRVGEPLKPEKAAQTIKNLYKMGYFRDIRVDIDPSSPTTMSGAAPGRTDAVSLIVTVTEKPRVEQWVFEGNAHLTEKEIDKKMSYSSVETLDVEELDAYVKRIKKLYQEKDYHHVAIVATLDPVPDESPDHARRVIAKFQITEGPQTSVRRIFFTGNETIASKKLRSLLFTREGWLLGFLNKAGSYQPDAIEYDRYTLENFYQNHGFITARVKDVHVQELPGTADVDVTFDVEEGERYRLGSVVVNGNEILSSEELLPLIAMRPGDWYSKELVRRAIETLKMVWGEYGYLYAEIEPIIVPDETTRTVSVEFNSILGSKMYVNRISIMGNMRTRDSTIRRMIRLYEGDLITTSKMDAAKEAISSLGFFDQQAGVNWKVTKLDQSTADLSLLLQDRPTGRIFFQAGFGGQGIDSPSTRFNITLNVNDINAFGTGVRYNIAGSYSAQDSSITANIFSPWIFDRPIGIGADIQQRRLIYDDFKNTLSKPQEVLTGGSVITRFTARSLNFVSFQSDLGAQRIVYNHPDVIPEGTVEQQAILQEVINRRFQSGTLLWWGTAAVQDFRDHPLTPSRGYQWLFSTKVGIPHSACDFGFFKLTADAQWLTPLINENDLVLRLHGFFGYIYTFHGHSVPYRELFHIGGPDTVRGYLFGQIGPTFRGDSFGGQKALVLNTEFIFPVTRDQNIRGVFFYDGGAGWDTPNRNLFGPLLINNSFNYRHAVGFGVRLMQPTPVKIDVGFKLDANRRAGEPISEIHFSMVQEF